MGKGFTFKEAALRLKAKFPYYTLLKYQGTQVRATILDEEYGVFIRVYCEIMRGATGHPKRTGKRAISVRKTQKSRKLTLEQAILNLAKKQPHLKIIKFTGREISGSVFEDKEYPGEYFKTSYMRAFYGWVKHPKRHLENVRKAAKSPKRNQKRQETNRQRYGVNEALQHPDKLQKMTETNLERYKVRWTQQNKKVRKKGRKTSKERYGVECIFSDAARMKEIWVNALGVDNPNKLERVSKKVFETNVRNGHWSRIPKPSRPITKEYYRFRRIVLEKYGYKCKKCGSEENLDVHHIKNFLSHPELGYEPTNGIPLCWPCHIMFHRTFGYRNNTKYQLNKYLKSE